MIISSQRFAIEPIKCNNWWWQRFRISFARRCFKAQRLQIMFRMRCSASSAALSVNREELAPAILVDPSFCKAKLSASHRGHCRRAWLSQRFSFESRITSIGFDSSFENFPRNENLCLTCKSFWIKMKLSNKKFTVSFYPKKLILSLLVLETRNRKLL